MANLAPIPKLRFEDNSGNPASGYLLFVYNAGTTTKATTYTDSGAGTPNANPIVLDSRGECNCWLTAGSKYKFVLAPSTDTDPPTNPVWTVDNVSSITDLNNVELTGVPTAPTAAAGTSTTQIATTAFVETAVGNVKAQSQFNPFRNPTCSLTDGTTPPNLTGSYIGGPVLAALAKVTGTLTAGTFTSGTTTLGINNTQAKCAGVTGDITSAVSFCWRIGGSDLARFEGQITSFEAKVRQESGLTANVTINVSTANALNNFSAVTLVGSTTTTVPTSTDSSISLNAQTLGANINGLQIEVIIQPGGTFTAKDFYVTDIGMNAGSTSVFVPSTYAEERAEANDTQIWTYKDTGAVNAFTITTGDYIPFLFDRQQFHITIGTTSTSTTPTLAVNGGTAINVTGPNGSAIPVGAFVAGATYRFVYDRANNRFIVQGVTSSTVSQVVFTTAGTGSTTVPAGYLNMRYRLGGAGAGGGSITNGGANTLQLGCGGGGGEYREGIMPVTPGGTVSYTVGAGGAGGNIFGAANPGVAGGDTSITYSATTITAKGGSAGGNTTVTSAAAGGAGGTGGSGGTVIIPGRQGVDGIAAGNTTFVYVKGCLGGAAGGGLTGSGGSGAYNLESGSAAAGTAGKDGIVILEFF